MEYLDIRTKKGEVTGEVKERTQVHMDGDIHGTSHVWLVRYKDNEKKKFDILLQKRAAGKDAYAGCYDISSAGHIPAGQDYLESAVRELYEELGIQAEPSKLKFIGMHDGTMEAVFHGKPFRNHELSAVYIYDEPVADSDFKLQEQEVESVLWIDFDECKNKLWTGKIQNCIFESEFKMLEKAIRSGKKGNDTMNKIASFTVNHLDLLTGIYVSRKDYLGEQVLTTFDLRFTRPNEEAPMDNPGIHTIEHLVATFLRNHKTWADKTVYFGPMGCRTGFYVIFAGDLQSEDILDVLREAAAFVLDYEGEIPGYSPRDCGNYLDNNLNLAKIYMRKFKEEVLDNPVKERLAYPQ